MKTLKEIVGENLIELRKNAKLTQFELAEKMNYSDKSISKWENGDTLPDLATLNELCQFYGVTLDYLTHPVEENKEKYVLDKDENKRTFTNRILTIVLVNLVIWSVALVVFIYAALKDKIGEGYWLSLIYAIPVSCIVSVIFCYRYFKKPRIPIFVFWSAFVWSTLMCVFLTTLPHEIVWPIFLIGVPAQGAIVTRFFIKKKDK